MAGEKKPVAKIVSITTPVVNLKLDVDGDGTVTRVQIDGHQLVGWKVDFLVKGIKMLTDGIPLLSNTVHVVEIDV